NVFNYGTTTVLLGDSVVVAGVVDQYNGKTELSSATITTVARNRTVPSPQLVPFNYPLTERHEGRLLLVVGDVVQAPVRSGSGSNIVIKNGTPAIAIRVNDPTGIDLSWVTVGRRIRFIGIGGQYDPKEPYNSGYQLMPRFQTDLYDTTAAFEPAERLQIDTVTPNPFVPRQGQVLTIQVNSPRSFRLTVELYDLEGRLVKELLSNGPGGYYDLKWGGTDRLGRPLPAGIYLLAIRGSTGSGQTEVISRPIALAEDLR
ncbi:MAG: FlgD immunoglobulin-like domain containing protein, partial [candidate division WOR-3 bacterium]